MAMAIRRRPVILIYFLLAAAAPSFLFAPVVHAATPALVDELCRETHAYDICKQALGSDPRTPGAKDRLDVTGIVISLAISNSTSSRSYINGLYESTEDPKKKAAFKICVSGYDTAVVSFQSALEELKQDPSTAINDSKAAGDGVRVCEDQLGADTGVIDVSITTLNWITLSFSNIAELLTAGLIKSK